VETIVKLWNHFNGRVGIGFGWGTMLTNNFPEPVKPISLVCKVFESNGKSAVKLSDNYTKATGNIMEVARYREIFGVEGIANAPVIV
jgi:nicotinate phosphoribosyltransferase